MTTERELRDSDDKDEREEIAKNFEQRSAEEINAERETRKKQEAAGDARLYVPRKEGWTAEIKANSLREYCHQKNPAENHYHLLGAGEIFLQKGNEKYCLNCAMRLGFLTIDRMHWQLRDSMAKRDPE